ncbi:hypothetical protein OFN32_37885, partial [Escherichia coli]|nr:hypothetical protein [Escherichia coli]
FPGMRLRHPVTDDTSDDRLAHSPADRMYMLGGRSDTASNGVVWTMEYGPFDLPVARTDGEGHRWQYRYDKDTLQLTEVINPQ